MKGYSKDRYTGEYILNPLLKLIGAKTRNRDFLYQFFPPHDEYIEVFMGTGGVLIGKPSCNYELIGDLDSYAINFYKQVIEKPDFLFNAINEEIVNLTEENGKEYFEGYKYLVTRTRDDSVRAASFYLINRLSMNGIWRLNKKGECNSSYCSTVKGRGYVTKDRLNEVRNRIKNVNFTCSDYRTTLVESVARPNSFTFVDPPYRNCKTTYNGVKFSDADHRELKEHLSLLPGKWLLTINDDNWVRGLYAEFEILPWSVHYSCSQTNSGRGKRPELLIANYQLNSKNDLSIVTKSREG